MSRRPGTKDMTAEVPGAAGTAVLVFEPAKNHARRAQELLRGLGYRVLVTSSLDEAAGVLGRERALDVALVAVPGGEEVVRAALARGSARPPVILALAREADAVARCGELGADTWVSRPFKLDPLAAALRAAEAISTARRRARELEADLAAERARVRGAGEPASGTGLHRFEFFKQLLVMELKRARRYGYSLAACLVAIDGAPPADQSVARAIRAVVRDIDMPVDYADGRFLVFLPYTDLAGAERVGRRLEATVRLEGQATISVGIAALKKEQPVGFARLVRDANLALRAAQLKGGGQVVVKK